MFLTIPVDPDAGTARDWVVEELQKPEYSQGDRLIDRIIQWILSRLGSLFQSSDGSIPPAYLLGGLALVALVAYAAWLTSGPMRLRRASRRGSSAVLDDDPRSAKEIRASARSAAEAGEWSIAVLEQFRAIIRALEERTVIAARRGRTAYEAARQAGIALPQHASTLISLSRSFDAVCYGHAPGNAETYAAMLAADDALLRATPEFAEGRA